ncbi:GntR family transcriptional regulator [Ammonicoccus fulvus]|uniref:GntR family transcriptional regulator n=1 Tax=Ammonicoccus fulvus TaxID=3138240 RepID=A0ABZ3FLJ1_9ACTN
MRPSPGSRTAVVGGRLANQVYDDLKQKLLAGEYAAGAPLVVAGICADYGVSKQPVMEAMRALAADRLVEIQPQVGVRVRQFDEGEVRAFFWLFARCEGAMAHRAAELRSDDELHRLEVLCDRMRRLEAATAGDVNSPTYLKANREIHGLIHSMARSTLAADISYDLWDLSDFLIATHGDGFAGRLSERNHGHDEVLQAIRDQNPEAAEAAMIEHVLSSPLGGGAPEIAEPAVS